MTMGKLEKVYEFAITKLIKRFSFFPASHKLSHHVISVCCKTIKHSKVTADTCFCHTHFGFRARPDILGGKSVRRKTSFCEWLGKWFLDKLPSSPFSPRIVRYQDVWRNNLSHPFEERSLKSTRVGCQFYLFMRHSLRIVLCVGCP